MAETITKENEKHPGCAADPRLTPRAPWHSVESDTPLLPMKVFFTLQSAVQPTVWEPGFLTEIRAYFAQHPESRYQLAGTPQAADLIVLLESNYFRTQRDIPVLLQEPTVRDFPDKTFTINYEDFPAGFLPGLYAALPVQRFDLGRHRAWSYLFPSNAQVGQIEPRPLAESDDLLFSFRGAESHPLRRRLFDLKLAPDTRGRILKIDRWFNHNAQEVGDYVEEVQRSRFALCPRGAGASSHRLFEVMALGRCPVIISDEWVAPDVCDWEQCSIRVAERDVTSLPAVLAAREADAPALGKQARAYWERFFAPDRKFETALDALFQLKDSRPPGHDERECQRLWQSRAFWRSNGWTLSQRVGRKADTLWRKVFGR